MDLIHKSISYAVQQLTATQPLFTIFYQYRACLSQFDYVKLHICKKKSFNLTDFISAQPK